MIKKLILMLLSICSLTSCMGNLSDSSFSISHHRFAPSSQMYSRLRLFVLKDNVLYSSYNMRFNEHLKLKVYGCSYSFQTVELNIHDVQLSIDGVPTINALDILENYDLAGIFDLTASLNDYTLTTSNTLTIAHYDWYRPSDQIPNIRVSQYNICR